MSDLRELYQEYVLDHGRRPRNFRLLEGATHQADGYNPLCGDKIALRVLVEGERIADIGFLGSGCAISTASASTMTEVVKGKTLREAHEYFEAFDSWLPAAGIEYYYYDQLGSAYSDQPDDPRLLDTARFVEEVEQVRKALKLDKDNFYLLGHSWGGILAMEYALKYPQHLKGLIISNMMSSIPAYNRYARETLEPQMDPAALAPETR